MNQTSPIDGFSIQISQMLLVLLLSPLLTGLVRKVKAQLLRRQGPPIAGMPVRLWGENSRPRSFVRRQRRPGHQK